MGVKEAYERIEHRVKMHELALSAQGVFAVGAKTKEEADSIIQKAKITLARGEEDLELLKILEEECPEVLEKEEKK